MSTCNLNVNGSAVSAEIQPRTHLADFLREKLNLTGTHLGCEHGVCGACTLLVDGVPTRSCITFALACQQADVTTIEGLDDDEITRELRAAFTREHGLQCGYCTPGMVVSARDVVLRMQDPSERDIRVAMSGNLCRCTGYVGIVRAIQGVIADRRGRGIAAIPNGNRTRLGPSGSGNATAVIAAAARPKTTAAPTAIKVEAPTAAAASLRDTSWNRKRPSRRASPSGIRSMTSGISSPTSARWPPVCRAHRWPESRSTVTSTARSRSRSDRSLPSFKASPM